MIQSPMNEGLDEKERALVKALSVRLIGECVSAMAGRAPLDRGQIIIRRALFTAAMGAVYAAGVENGRELLIEEIDRLERTDDLAALSGMTGSAP